MKSVMQFNFANNQAPNLQRSVFNRSHGHKTTFDAGKLPVIFCQEILPGDFINLGVQLFARLATLKTPIMDNMFLDMFWFFVPNRLIWEHWEQFMGAKSGPSDTSEYVVPSLVGDPMEFDQGSIYDYFRLPTKVSMDTHISALPFRAYELIYREWFRDENLQDEEAFPIGDGPDNIAEYSLKTRGKRYDYFTSLLPWPQKGDAVMLPLGTTAPVIGNGTSIGFSNGTNNLGGFTINGDQHFFFNKDVYGLPTGSNVPANNNPSTTKTLGLTTDPEESGIVADLSNATAATVNQIREAVAMQQLFELDARSGTRYTEILQNQWGQNPQDFRLQRPEYLGGNSQRMGVTQVPQTSESGTTKQATLAAYGQTVSSMGFSKSFVEHGYVIGIANVRSDITYQQGLDRMWSRETRFDFYNPVLAHLGEQPVLRQEIFYDETTPANNIQVFGYGERWNEYRSAQSGVSGLFRSNATGTLDFWHLATEFETNPVLNAAFIMDDPPVDRVIAVPAEPHVIMDCYFDLKHARQMPVYSTPGLMRF